MGGATGNLKGYEERIIRDSGICGGEPVFKGTRVTLRTVLASLAGGDSAEEVLADFPSRFTGLARNPARCGFFLLSSGPRMIKYSACSSVLSLESCVPWLLQSSQPTGRRFPAGTIP